MLTRPINILLVEDNMSDVLVIKDAFKSLRTRTNIYNVTDGVDTINYLYKRGDYQNCPGPDLILLDLGLPLKSGLEVLKEIKKEHDFQSIPILILTVSDSSYDLQEAYNFHANAYIVKPDSIDGFTKMALSIENFWLTNVNLPTVEII